MILYFPNAEIVDYKFIYISCVYKHVKSKTTVYSIRIPIELRKLMESVDVNWQEEIRRSIEQRLRKEIRKKMLKEARELRKKTKRISSAELIREDRDAR